MDIVLKQVENEALKAQWQAAFGEERIGRPEGYFDRCLTENQAGTRVTLLAFADGRAAGCAHLKYVSDYPHFRERHIPEINDLHVFPAFRRHGVANRLIDEFETIVNRHYNHIGIGVGLYKDYGPAQRIYCRRGYIPDGHGVMYRDEEVRPGQTVPVDDELVLYFVKELDYD
ncbi:GNAT family N-acetyltransferase [Paenibacillus sp. GCM10023250]|uniref:GNAT family N-acetyltransferase n=1 Tax=Paenibacillus sp. GCM10023250 TaxID=3252648 RepID=UPI00361F1124